MGGVLTEAAGQPADNDWLQASCQGSCSLCGIMHTCRGPLRLHYNLVLLRKMWAEGSQGYVSAVPVVVQERWSCTQWFYMMTQQGKQVNIMCCVPACIVV